jgi:hypothetical protein
MNQSETARLVPTERLEVSYIQRRNSSPSRVGERRRRPPRGRPAESSPALTKTRLKLLCLPLPQILQLEQLLLLRPARASLRRELLYPGIVPGDVHLDEGFERG